MKELYILKRIISIIVLVNIFCPQSVKSENDLAKNLQIEIDSIKENFPDFWNTYVENLNSIGNVITDKCDISRTEHHFKHLHKFSGEVIDEFNDIIYAQSTLFKTFNFAIKDGHSNYNQFIGAARVVGNDVEFAYIETKTTSNLKPKTRQEKYQDCHKILFIPVCDEKTRTIVLPYDEQDLILIYHTLKAHSYAYIYEMTKRVLTALETKQFVLSENSLFYSDNDLYFLVIQQDGNLVLYSKTDDGKSPVPIWASLTYHHGINPYMLVIEKNGDLIVYDADWKQKWIAVFEKNENLPFSLNISNEGQMQLVDTKGKVMWKNGDKSIIKYSE